ncbi:eukaryotic translation initiation factor 4E-binding protein Mextli isoform X2 [Eurytemora carolleeae]|uniref:eukaryotic translation initiation factor 4E-binding protein Mextli isoform X2 n=1 Tax=Eurytemora carolleeae TaxID=1294199 RepID=UPI000C778811|nr:eukaryotic translation initiation factor 4E-binding protein Mextli isoform X2 [Eurytemora carolleeae]|eukprot:XP_023322482.1 eukaryotic translation initiation factor 4E-binding protein Mextli-like isoform X2 [Eurytemora affinis]
MSLGRSNSTGVLAAGKRRPRPLKIGGGVSRLSAIELSSVEDVIVLMENMVGQLNNRNYEYLVLSSLARLCESLKQCGPQLETLYQDQLDKLGIAVRDACRDGDLDLMSRVQLLEIIELRAMNWVHNENTSAYFRQKFSQIEQDTGMSPMIELRSAQTAPISLNANAPDFNPTLSGVILLKPGEIITTSGRFIQPTKIPGKTYFKDEIVIRNADSGKVMGLKGRRVHLIEEITETIISFQRVVPGAKERLVQITGPAPDNILQAKRLIEDTIRRNQSPGREDGAESPQDISPSDDSRRNTLTAEQRDRNSVSITEYKYTVNIGDNHIKITGGSLDLVRTAKLVLDEYFSLSSSPLTAETNIDDIILPGYKPNATLSSHPLHQYSSHPLSSNPLHNFSNKSSHHFSSNPPPLYSSKSSSHLIQESAFSTIARPKKNC